MKTTKIAIMTAAVASSAVGMAVNAAEAAMPLTIVQTDAYRWQGDTIFQDEFKAWAENPYELRSTYKGRPGYFMPVEQKWTRKNDLSAYPKLTTGNLLHQAIYNLALDEMVNAVEPDTTLRTGKEWAGVWTRDVSYSIILSMAALQPEASMISLLKKVNPEGQIIQDTGSGGAWPVSTDRMVWALAAWEIYKNTGDKEWIKKVYPIVERSLAKDRKTIYSERGLVKGETSFIDWREQSYPKWMQTVDISQSEAMGTNVMYAAALKCASEMASVLGYKKQSEDYAAESAALAANIEKYFAREDSGNWGMYSYGADTKILNPRTEALGQALAVLYDVATPERQRRFSESIETTPFGVAVFYPQISDMPSYHNNSLWPWVGAYWGLAQAKAGNEQGVLESIGSVFRPAALFTTNKENFNLDNGDYYTELNSSNMLWCLSGNLALTNRILFGIIPEKDGLCISPFVPETLGGTRTLSNYPYRGARLDITVEGYGSKVAALWLDGKKISPEEIIPAKKIDKGTHTLRVEMDNEPIAAMSVNHQPNRKAPITPITRLTTGIDGAPLTLEWEPIEYIGEYIVLKDGKEYKRTHSTTLPVTEKGVWQVMGVAGDGTPGFASRPIDNRDFTDYQVENAVTIPASAEMSYAPRHAITGYTGKGFAELDKKSAPFVQKVKADKAGEYVIEYYYANGNGPVNTENKCAIRTLKVDGEPVATMVFPTRGVGNWDDWGLSNPVVVTLGEGEHEITLEYQSQDSNMNLDTNHLLIDRLRLIKR